MMKGFLLVALVSVLAFSVIASATYLPDQNKITLPIHKGWNLVPATSWEGLNANSAIKPSDFKYVFVYDVPNNKYILSMKDGQPVQRELNIGSWFNENNYGLKSSVWAYSEKEGDLVYGWGYSGFNSQNFELSKYNLIKGWNFVFITPYMKRVSFGDFKGNCNIVRTCAFERNSGNCGDVSQVTDSMTLIDSDWDIGQTLVIKVSENCNLAGSTITPPAIPN